MRARRGSNAAVLLGEESPVQLRDHRDAILDLIQSLRGEVADEFSMHEKAPFRNHLFADGSSTIAILGERGGGKTTLLFMVCAALMSEGFDLVLPPMRPELFSPNESVISAFLASLWTTLADDSEEVASEEKADSEAPRTYLGDDLVQLLTDCARSYAASRTTREALAHATDSTVDYAEDAVAISRSGARLPWQLGELTRKVCLSDPRRPRQVVIPVDDPDLAPETVRTILRDLRVLGSIPGVVPIASFCPVDLADAWRGHRDDESFSGRIRTARLFERETEKLFPYRSRFEIQPLDVLDRIDFIPVGESEPLKAKLRDLRTAVEPRQSPWPIDDALMQSATRYGLPNPLPQNPRALIQIWSTLAQSETTGEMALEELDQMLRNLCALLSEPLRMSLGLTAGESFYSIGLPLGHDEAARGVVRIDLDDLHLYVSLAGQYAHSEDSDQVGSIGIRRIVQVKSSRPMRTDSADDRREVLPQAATSALLAFNEIVYGSGRFAVETEGVWRLEERDWAAAQEVVLAGLATDDNFLRLPEAMTLSEVINTVDTWNRLAEMAERGISSERLLTAALEAVCEMAEGEGVEKSPSASYADAFARATDIYRSRCDRNDRPSERFCRWYEQDLPMQWHGAFFSAPFLRECCATYREVTTAAFRRGEHDSLVNPRMLIDARFKYILDAITDDGERYSWMAGYFELAAGIESTQIEKLSALNDAWRARTMALQAGSSAAGQISVLTSGSNRLAPFPSPEGQELYTRARELLRQRVAAVTRGTLRRKR